MDSDIKFIEALTKILIINKLEELSVNGIKIVKTRHFNEPVKIKAKKEVKGKKVEQHPIFDDPDYKEFYGDNE